MFNKKSQSGRSMVEMLGVLAIIGVLSIGGIAGYTMSMRKHRANQVADVLNKYALVLYGACQRAVINGDITELKSCKKQQVPSFSDADLGTMTELHSIHFTGISHGYLGDSSTGKDFVNISISFNDEKICKTYHTLIGRNSITCPNTNFDFGFK